ncbi:MAG: UPF0182 family protein [Acidobacteriota bacterium]|nr:UPF0182 family protein [Acidobacteriota bacterium]
MTLSSRIFSWVFGAIFLLILIAKALTLWTDYLWFGVMGQPAVFSTVLWTRVVLVVVVGVLFFGWVWINLRIARKPLPADVTLIGKRLMPDEERAQVEEYADKALLIFALIAGLMAGLVASSKWLPWLQFTHAVDFGDTDPLFGRDAGFYVFRLSFLQYIYRTAFYGVIIALVTSILVHLYQEAIRIAGNTIQTISRARAHVYSLVAVALLLKVWGYHLDMLALVFSRRGGSFSGAAYADVYGRMPVMYALMVLCVIAAAVIVSQIRSRRLFWPAGALAVVILFSLLGGSVYPALVQKLVVLPTQLEKEQRFIEYNINATNKAFDLADIDNRMHNMGGPLTWQDIEANRGTIDNIRLWDHRPLERTMDQTQALRAYYDFPDVDVDRYTVDGRYRQVMLAPRQIDSNKIPPPKSWVNERLQYTHGYGVAAAPVSEIERGDSDEGLPKWWVKDIPPQSVEGMEIDEDRAGIYFYASIHPRYIEYIQRIDRRERAGTPEPEGGQAQQQPDGPGGPGAATDRPGAADQKLMDEPLAKIEDFVLVNTEEKELHYPRLAQGASDDPNATGADSNAYHNYSGKSGVPIGGFFRRLAFFARFHDLNLLLTQSLNKDSKVIINRTLPERIQALMPYFAICDPDPYICIIDGKLTWINDVYTYTRMYPYSTPHRVVPVNYLRNSIKVTVDAYDGIPEFYVVDDADPMVKCYQKIFPTLFKTEPAPAKVREHFRYPQLLFMVQAEMYADYHMRDAKTFYQREDSWSIATELYATEPRMVEAYYAVMKLPGEDREEFLLMIPFTLRGREDRNMVAWMAARCDGDKYGELVCFKMPKSALVEGPMQVETRVSQNRGFSERQTLWSQKGSTIIRGNMLVIPVEDSLLYAEPIYIAGSVSAIPELKLVVLVHNKRVALGDDLEDALRKLFGEPGANAPAAKPTTEIDAPRPPAGNVLQLLDKALQLDAQAQQALASGDLGEYQRLHREISDILREAKGRAE